MGRIVQYGGALGAANDKRRHPWVPGFIFKKEKGLLGLLQFLETNGIYSVEELQRQFIKMPTLTQAQVADLPHGHPRKGKD
jgi:hypothetical protein